MHVPGKLGELHQLAVRRRAREDEPGVANLRTELVVHLIAVAMAFGNRRFAVGCCNHRAFGEFRFPQSEPHRAAHVALPCHDVELLRHGGDDGIVGVGFEFAGRRTLEAHDVACVLDDHALQAEAQPQGRNPILPRVGQGAELALEAPDPESTGHADGVHAAECLAGTLGGLAIIGRHPLDVDLRLVGEPAGAQRLGDRKVGIGKVDVLADQRHLDVVLRIVDDVEKLVPLGPVDVLELQVEGLDDIRVEPLRMQDLGDVVDARGVGCVDDGVDVDVAHAADLLPHGQRHLAVGTNDDRIGLDADRAQHRHRVLCRLGLQLLRGADVRDQ